MKTCFKPVITGLFLVFAFFPEMAISQPRAYIANWIDGTVSVIDTNTRTVVDTITVGAYPTHVAVNEPGTRVYVRNGETVSVIDTATNTVIANPTIPGGALFLNADGSRLFTHNDFIGNIFTIDTANYSVLANNTMPSNSSFRAFAVNRQGTFAYATELCCGNVAGLDLISNTWPGRIQTGFGPQAMVLNRSATLLYVFNSMEYTLAVVDTFASQVKTKIGDVPSTKEMAISPDGSRVYLASQFQNSVAVIDTVTNTVAATIVLDSVPSGLTVNPADNSLYVTLPDSNSVVVIDASTNAVVATIPVGSSPKSVGVFIPQFLPAGQPANLAIRARGASTVTVGSSTKINVVMDNYGPGSAINPSVLIETNAPGSSMYATVSDGWTCMQNPNAVNANFVCASNNNMPVGSRPSIVLRFIAPRSMASSKLVLTSQISSDSGDTNILNNTHSFSMKVESGRGIRLPITSPAAITNKR